MAEPGGTGTPKLRRALTALALAMASLVCVILLRHTRFFHLLELKVYDRQFMLRGRQPVSGIMLLVIDQKSLDELSDKPLNFWHPYYAEAIRAAAEAGAKAFGLDVFFEIPVGKWEPENDKKLAEAASNASATMPVICGFVPSSVARQKTRPINLYLLAAATGQIAFLNLQVDPDDFVRRQQLLEGGDGPIENRTRAFALRIAEKFLQQDVREDRGRLRLGDTVIPVDSNGSMTINYAGPPGTFPRVPLLDFLEAARAGDRNKLRGWVGGKIVLLGIDRIPDADRHATPYYTLEAARANTAGVEIHASTVHTILTRRFVVPVSGRAETAMLFLLALLGAGISSYWRLQRAGLTVLAVATTSLMTSHLLFRAGVVVPAAALLVSLCLPAVATLLYQTESRRAFFARALSIFVGRRAAATLEQSEQITMAAGARQTVTVLFSDIRGFTAFCEEKEPPVVVETLNTYLTSMVEIIMRHGGEVNKFIGDGILAVFNDQDPGAHPGDHALRAVQCGLEMAQAPGTFKTGVAIHTGEVVAGNVGSFDKLEYTVLGDTVNLAARIEGLNKEFETRMLLSEDTYRRLDGAIPMTDLGPANVRGRSRPLRVFSPAALVHLEAVADRHA